MSQVEIWTTLKVLNWTKDFLLTKGVQNARLEAEWLLCKVTGLDRVGLYLQYDKSMNNAELEEYRNLVARRAKREPLQHILGTQEFCGLDFEVCSDVLIPRHDTEILVAEACKRNLSAATILDIGTGSGCIAVSLQKKYPQAVVTATDISEAALSVAKCNAKKHNVTIEFVLGSLFVPLADRRFDMIISNPPYIPTSDIDSLEKEVRVYDPFKALNGGIDGLDIYRQLIPSAVNFLNPDGWLLVEVGIGQANDIVTLINITGNYYDAFVTVDDRGIERVVSAKLKEKG